MMVNITSNKIILDIAEINSH